MHYAYILFTCLFLVPWGILFWLRKDLRFEMVWAGVIVAVFGLIAEGIWYTKDWVNPITLTNTIIGIEDAIMGFAAGGIAAVIYKDVCRQDDYKCRAHRLKTHWKLSVICLLGLIVADALFRFFGIFSFYANLIGFGLIAIILISIREDLLKEALIGGLLLVVVSLPIYWISFYIFPGWRESYWKMTEISRIYFFGIPYEDLVWWFFAGINIAIAYDCYSGHCLRKLPEASYPANRTAK